MSVTTPTKSVKGDDVNNEARTTGRNKGTPGKTRLSGQLMCAAEGTHLEQYRQPWGPGLGAGLGERKFKNQPSAATADMRMALATSLCLSEPEFSHV